MDGLVRSVAPLSADLASLMKMTSATPAGVLGEQERLGVIAPGRFADLVVLDQDLHVAATLVGGEIVYEGSGSSR
jgi:N-acetylglucosamine-6-phosphate deacetylase